MDFNISHIDVALKILSKGTKATSGAASLVGKVNTVLKTGGASETELESVVFQLTSEVHYSKLANLDLKEKLILLREEMVKLQFQQKEFDRYELYETPAGDRVYSLRKTDKTGESYHCICPKCKEDGKKSILQGTDTLLCNACKNFFNMRLDKPQSMSSRDPYF